MSKQEQQQYEPEFEPSFSNCSFCGIHRVDSYLVIGPLVSICGGCAEDALRAVNEYKDTHGPLSLIRTS